MTAKIHSDHAFILLSQQVGLLHGHMLAIKQNLHKICSMCGFPLSNIWHVLSSKNI